MNNTTFALRCILAVLAAAILGVVFSAVTSYVEEAETKARQEAADRHAPTLPIIDEEELTKRIMDQVTPQIEKMKRDVAEIVVVDTLKSVGFLTPTTSPYVEDAIRDAIQRAMGRVEIDAKQAVDEAEVWKYEASDAYDRALIDAGLVPVYLDPSLQLEHENQKIRRAAADFVAAKKAVEDARKRYEEIREINQRCGIKLVSLP